jgi:hypothetical protein
LSISNSQHVEQELGKRIRPTESTKVEAEQVAKGEQKNNKTAVAGSVVGPLLVARALPLRCAASAVLISTLANCGA